MTKKRLDILGDEETSGFSLSINPSYAQRYNERKRKQEISQLEDKHKAKLQKKGIFKPSSNENEANANEEDESESDYTDSESDEEEDDEGELLTPAVDAQILKTLSEIRSRSQKVYDPTTNFFDEKEIAKIDQDWRNKHTNNKKNSLKPDSKPKMTVRDYQRERILSGKALEEAEHGENEEDFEPEPLTHVQEQELLKAEMKRAFGSSKDDEGEGEDGLLTVRVKGDHEIAMEEEEYRNFLLENLASSENAKLSMGEWLSYREETDGVNPKAGKSRKQLTDDDFLIEYVLSKGWVDKQASRVPSYDKIIEEDIVDEEADEQADEFELAHNFRYEQEGGTQIETFSRKIEGSMRREESKRKDQRISSHERKAHEKLQKAEELKRLKNLKMAEIKKKLEKITATSGTKTVAAVEDVADEFEDEFDPEKHDKLMKKLINFDEEDGDDKPVFSSDSEIDFTSDEEEEKPVIKKATKALKKAAKKVSKDDESDETEKTRLSKYLDELYNMDYEDLIGDIPCRFKYQQVEPSTYGLTLDEILTADDTQLNSYFSLKKLAPYRPADRQAYDIQKYTSKHRVHQFRKSLKESQRNAKNGGSSKKQSSDQ